MTSSQMKGKSNDMLLGYLVSETELTAEDGCLYSVYDNTTQYCKHANSEQEGARVVGSKKKKGGGGGGGERERERERFICGNDKLQYS